MNYEYRKVLKCRIWNLSGYNKPFHIIVTLEHLRYKLGGGMLSWYSSLKSSTPFICTTHVKCQNVSMKCLALVLGKGYTNIKAQ